MLSIHLPTDRRHRWDGRRQRQGPVTMAHPEDLRTDNIARRTPFLPGTSRPVGGAVPTARIFRPARSVMSSGQRRKPIGEGDVDNRRQDQEVPPRQGENSA